MMLTRGGVGAVASKWLWAWSMKSLPVRLCEDALPWSGKEHSAVADVVRAVDGPVGTY